MRGGSDLAWEGAHSLTALSSDAIILGDICEMSRQWRSSGLCGNTFWNDVGVERRVTNVFLGPRFHCNDFLAGGGVPPPHF